MPLKPGFWFLVSSKSITRGILSDIRNAATDEGFYCFYNSNILWIFYYPVSLKFESSHPLDLMFRYYERDDWFGGTPRFGSSCYYYGLSSQHKMWLWFTSRLSALTKSLLISRERHSYICGKPWKLPGGLPGGERCRHITLMYFAPQLPYVTPPLPHMILKCSCLQLYSLNSRWLISCWPCVVIPRKCLFDIDRWVMVSNTIKSPSILCQIQTNYILPVNSSALWHLQSRQWHGTFCSGFLPA